MHISIAMPCSCAAGDLAGGIERLPIAAYICDASGAITSYNSRAAELWGIGNEACRFCGAYRLYQPDGAALPRDRAPAAQVLATGEPVADAELTIERPDGARATVLLNAAPLFREDGALAGAVCCAQDVTNWKRLTELRYRFQKLEALGQLTANVAHDFSNLLATIALNVSLIGKRVSDPAVLRFARSAQRAIERGSLLTGQLLACAGKQKLDPQRSDLNAVIRAMRGILRQAMGPAVRLEILSAEGLWPVLADAAQLELAILSLAANARSAMSESGQLVVQTANRRLEARQAELPAGDYAVVSIMDDGEGMSEDVLARAFDPFFATPGAGRRTGLGLSTVMGMARQHGGSVRIDSRIGQGTKVDIYLPRADAARRPAGKPARAAADAMPRPPEGESRCIPPAP